MNSTVATLPSGPLDLKILRVTFLRGPNIWTYRSTLEVWLDLGVLEEWPSHRLPGFVDRLLARLPGVGGHKCGVGEEGGFLIRLREGTWLGHVLEHVVIEMLNLAGMPTGFGQTRSTSQHGVYRMVFRARDEAVARMALEQGHEVLRSALNDTPLDLQERVQKVRDSIDDSYLGPSTASIVAAATDRGIPHIRLNDGNLVQLGHGARQRRIWTAETERTSAIAEGISRDKDLTKQLLQACGVPVPRGRVVSSPEDAWSAAEDLGLPVVVKPTDANHGRGVALDLNRREDIETAYRVAEQEGSDVMVERYIRGEEHRLLVVGGRVVAAARGETAWVTGDGVNTVLQLIELQLNSDPRRGSTEDHPLNRIDVRDDGVAILDLERQGLTPDSVPEAKRRVLIQRNGNVSNDCTDQVHPEVDYIVSLAARIVGLDIAGIDVVAEDISRPLQEQGGAIVEVNAGPGLLMHLRPATGQARPVGRAIVDHLMPAAEHGDDRGRIPIVGVTGGDMTLPTSRLIAWILQLSGPRVGLASREGLFIGERVVERGDCTGHLSARRLLVNRGVEAAVFENDARVILEEGLAYDRCHVGVVTDVVGGPVLERHDMLEPEQWFKVYRSQVDVVLDSGAAVLNAEDPLALDMARLSDGEVVLFARSPDSAALRDHLSEGGRAVWFDGDDLVLGHDASRTVLLSRSRDLLPPVRALAPSVVLAAVAACWALGLSADLLRDGLETFEARGALRAPRSGHNVQESAQAANGGDSVFPSSD